ncbi:MAG: nucleotidyl transferase AbiEii/AbiGii toxin family protein [Bacteroidales bacterium]
MHKEILTKQQAELLPYIANFKRSFYLVGGTAIALHLGHRRSIDFDLFTSSRLDKSKIKSKLNQVPFKQVMLFEDVDQLHKLINGVKFTFFSFPYQIRHEIAIEKIISMPDLLTLASMKAFALGRRSKWKDYVDLYFILKEHYSIKEISEEANKNFPSQFSEKLFREQLAFHKDIDYSEPVEYIGEEIPEEEIKNFLVEKAIDLEL